MIKKVTFVSCIVLITFSIFSVQFVLAQDIGDDGPRLTDPLGDRQLPEIIGDAIRVGLGVVGAVALALFVYGGFVWMTAAGNAQRVSKGREILIWATIGLVVIFTSYALLNFVLLAVTGRG